MMQQANVPEPLQPVIQRIREGFNEDLEKVREFLRTPSISYTAEGIRETVCEFPPTPRITYSGEGSQETAENVARFIRERGGAARVVPTPGHPIVSGRLDQGAPKTVLVYGMYDVMPADEPDWSVDPWA